MRHLTEVPPCRCRGQAAWRLAGIWAALALALPAARAQKGAWRELASADGRQLGGVAGFVVDTAGTPWVLSREDLCWWDGKSWQSVGGGGAQWKFGIYVTSLWGGPDRGAYLSQPGSHEHEGLLYRLEKGKLQKVCDFYYDVPHSKPGLYVSRSGELYNWSARFVAAWRQGKWESLEMRMPCPSVVDLGPAGPVVFVPSDGGPMTIWEPQRPVRQAKLPALPPGPPDAAQGLRAVRWGKDRAILAWGSGLGLTAVEFGQTVRPVDASKITNQFAGRTTIVDIWPLADGSVWTVLTRRGVSGWYFASISPDGKLTELLETEGFIGSGPTFFPNPQKGVLARDGSVWLAPHRSSICRIRDGRPELFNWRQGLELSGTKAFVQCPGGPLYMAGWPGRVYRWDPDAPAVQVSPGKWSDVLCRYWPLAGPDGRVWAYRKDTPGHISQWDGDSWAHVRVPFGQRWQWAADETGYLVVLVGTWPGDDHDTGSACTIGLEGLVRFASFQDALLSRVRAGARRFAGSVRVAVTKDGRVWLVEPASRTVSIDACIDGKWELLELPQEIQAVLTNDERFEEGPMFVTSDSLWTYRAGKLVKVAQARKSSRQLRVVGPGYRWGLPYFAEFDDSVRRTHAVIAYLQRGIYVPVSWDQAEQIAAGRRVEVPARPGEVNLVHCLHAYPAGDRGFWLDGAGRWRLWQGHVVRLDGRGTPLAYRTWRRVGADGRGGMWAWPDNDMDGIHLFTRPAVSPVVKVTAVRAGEDGSVEITYQAGRDIAAVFCRVKAEEGDGEQAWQRAPAGGKIIVAGSRLEGPGRRVVLRAMDSVGAVGPEVPASAAGR